LCNLQQLKNRRYHVPQPTFLFPLETPLQLLSRNMLHGWKENSMLAKPSQHVPIYLLYFPIYTMLKSMRKSKNRFFYHILVSPGDAPGAITLKLYGWKENWMLTNCLAACAHLTITVSEIQRDICEKIVILSYLYPGKEGPEWRRRTRMA